MDAKWSTAAINGILISGIGHFRRRSKPFDGYFNREMTRRGARVGGGGSDWRINRWVRHFGQVARTFCSTERLCTIVCIGYKLMACVISGVGRKCRSEGAEAVRYVKAWKSMSRCGAAACRRGDTALSVSRDSVVAVVYSVVAVGVFTDKESSVWVGFGCNPGNSKSPGQQRVKIVESINGLSGSTGYIQDLRDQVKFKTVDGGEHGLREIYDVTARRNPISLGKTTVVI
uniref:Uncharacterized protein n=1 Tax=Oryza sativa subsp. japonica TaxID=39947 RepID=Q84RW4_ORYSJ|nr:hypothetical protein [Oryza sativa Japonica Group]